MKALQLKRIQFILLLLSLVSGYLCTFVFLPNVNSGSENVSVKAVDLYWYKILFHNLKIGVLILIAGFFSAGLISMLVFFWTGFIIGIPIMYLIDTGNSHMIIPLYIYHGIFELIAMFYLGIISFRGISFYHSIIKKNELSNPIEFLKIYELLIPVLMFTIASLIEANLTLFVNE